MDDNELDGLLHEFIAESADSLDQLDQELVSLERSSDPDVIARIFRSIHTIKGTSGFLGFGKLEAVTHVGENLLARLRNGELLVTTETTTALLALVDAVRAILSNISDDGTEGAAADDGLLSTLSRLVAGEPAEPAQPVAPDDVPVGETAVNAASDSIRIDVGLLDDLMNLVGELVLVRNQIVELAGEHAGSSLLGMSQQLDLITIELQESVMKTRMQPIENVWNRFPRVVRDLTIACGKSARLQMDGRSTEVDRTLLEAIKDPLTHLVRNAIDHGLELPAVRAAAGKPAEGVVRLSAFHEGGQVIVEMSDDGAGIDAGVIRRTALQKGLLTADEAAARSDREIVNLIFEPGFSTAEAVTNISGRGVGMDVVRTNIEAIGGSVEVHTALGVGTTFRVTIPSTLAIVPALVMTSANERCASLRLA